MIYSTIIFKVKRELGLSLREYIFLDSVYHLQAKTGYSYAKNEYYAELLDISIREVQKIKVQLSERGLLVIINEKKIALKVSEKWINSYLDNHEQKFMPTMNKSSTHHEQKDTYTIDKEIDKEIDIAGSDESLPKSPSKKKVLKHEYENDHALICEVIKEMELIDPKNKLFYNIYPQKLACDFLISTYGLESVKNMIQIISQNMQKIFNPPTTPVMLRDNWVRIIAQDAYKQSERMAKKPQVVHAE